MFFRKTKHKVLLFGGLGNQMFQYALYLALNKKGIRSTISFTSFFKDYSHNGFNLGRAFHLRLPLHLHVLHFFLRYGKFIYRYHRINAFIQLVSHKMNKGYGFYQERDMFKVDDCIFSLPPSILKGVWQDESYFKDFRPAILKAYRFRKPADAKNKKLAELILQTNAVCIHVRRGDYLLPKWSNTHAVITDNSYYLQAVDFIQKKVTNPHFFIFSDDPEWAKEHIKPANCTHVHHNTGENSYWDIYLMSLCKHNIISNSTFAWWGAWLNEHTDKIVVMPEIWLKNTNCSGIYPAGWVKMSVGKTAAQFSAL